jgi:hypothetical protein
MVMHEVRPGWTITKEWEGYQLQAELASAEVNPEEYLGILFSGGRAPENIRQDPDLIKLTQWFLTASKAAASPPSRNADSISKSAAASTSMNPSSSTATSSQAEPTTTTATTSARGSNC